MNLSNEAIRCLRVPFLPIGAEFLRCVPTPENWKSYVNEKERLDACYRIVREIGEEGVFLSFSEVVGGYYVRVNRGTCAFRFICRMKS